MTERALDTATATQMEPRCQAKDTFKVNLEQVEY